ncbi:hypothetical protein Q9L58_007909 [Maublancomyces gigas]|uniref:Uncharacterized protein n=1 Tax=Discina gigas TaxID=1032678 RepID=A0ABR3GBA4_9PEZI
MAVKQNNAWASQYILDPPTSVEARQETGPYQQQAPAASALLKSPQSKSSRKTPENRIPRPTHGRSLSASSIPRPLEQIKRETRRANRAPHLRKSAIPGPDTIDKLDNILGGIPYHHEGPFDATLMSRQIPGRSPVEALATSNAEAIAATPRANLIDSLERHRPLQGTASIPPGMRAPGGDILPYYEEYDVMTRDGNYRRYPGVEYLDEDLKGKGEPSYTLDKFDKQQKASRKARRGMSLGQNQYEMQPGSHNMLAVPFVRGSTGNDSGVRRNKSSAGRMESEESLSDRLKKRFSLKRRQS